MSTETPILAITEMEPSQAQPHLIVNDALRILEAIVQLRVTSRTEDTPPSIIIDGARYIVPEPALATWAQHPTEIAIAIGGVWRFVTPAPGWIAYVADDGQYVSYQGGSPSSWQPLSIGGGGPGGSIVAASAGAVENDFDPSGFNAADGVAVLRITPAGGGSTINGLAAGNAIDGQEILIHNQSASDTIALPDEAGASTAVNRFKGPGGFDMAVEPLGGLRVMYDASLSRWRSA